MLEAHEFEYLDGYQYALAMLDDAISVLSSDEEYRRTMPDDMFFLMENASRAMDSLDPESVPDSEKVKLKDALDSYFSWLQWRRLV